MAFARTTKRRILTRNERYQKVSVGRIVRPFQYCGSLFHDHGWILRCCHKTDPQVIVENTVGELAKYSRKHWWCQYDLPVELEHASIPNDLRSYSSLLCVRHPL